MFKVLQDPKKEKKNIQFCFKYEFEKIAYNLPSQVGTWIVYLTATLNIRK